MQSNNRYVYALNNPLRWIDPNGYKIEMSSNATESERGQYERAIVYLMTSETAAALIKVLEESSETITIVFNSNLNSSANSYNPKARTTNWNPQAGLVLRNKKDVMSAAMALAHEMGHASQHLDGTFSSLTNITGALRKQIETDNLKRHETTIASELGEYSRKKYGDASQVREMKNSTEWGYLKMPGSAWNPVNWVKPMILVNQNTWVWKTDVDAITRAAPRIH